MASKDVKTINNILVGIATQATGLARFNYCYCMVSHVLSTVRHVGICLCMAVQHESCTVTITIVQLEIHMALVHLKLYGKYVHTLSALYGNVVYAWL